jgi:hypothetical protein
MSYLRLNNNRKQTKKNECNDVCVYLVIRRLSRKLGEPCLLGIDGERDLYALLELDELSESELDLLLLETDLEADLELLLLDDDDL